MAVSLTTRQHTLLLAAYNSHQVAGGTGGTPARTVLNDPDVNQLIIMGQLQWHPPNKPPRVLIPTPLGRATAALGLERSERAKKAAKTRKAANPATKRKSRSGQVGRKN